MNGNLNAARGLLEGYKTGLDLIDRRDTKQRNMELQQRQDAAYEQGLADQQVQRERGDLAFDQQQEELLYQRERRADEDAYRESEREYQAKEREYQAGEREYQAGRREKTDAHQDALMPIQRQAARTQLATAQTNQLLAKQQAKNAEAAGIWQQASALAQGGDYQGAEKAIAKMEEYGYDVEGMSGLGAAEKATESVEKLFKGELDYNSPEVMQLTKSILTPSLVQSGRDPERFEIRGISPTGRTDEKGEPTYAIAMHDKTTGKLVPATINRSSSEDNDPNDPITEISQSDLMRSAQGFIEGSQNMAHVKFKALGARLGQQAVQAQTMSAKESLELDKTRAEIEKINAQTREITGEQQVPVGGGEGQAGGMHPVQERDMAERLQGTDPRVANIMQNLQDTGEFDYSTFAADVKAIDKMAGEKKYQAHTSSDLQKAYFGQKKLNSEMEALTTEKTENFLAQYPGLSEKDQADIAKRIAKQVDQVRMGKISMTAMSKGVQELHRRYEKKVPASPENPVAPHNGDYFYGRAKASPSTGAVYGRISESPSNYLKPPSKIDNL